MDTKDVKKPESIVKSALSTNDGKKLESTVKTVLGTKDGKKPLATKQTTTIPSHNELFGDATSLSPELKKELEEQGLVPHWVDYKQIRDMDGYHKKGWVIYRKEKNDIIDNQEFRFGRDPDGLVRRGSMVLAVKTKADWIKHKEFLKNKAERYGSYFKKRQVTELQKLAKNSGLDSTVVDGYDD